DDHAATLRRSTLVVRLPAGHQRPGVRPARRQTLPAAGKPLRGSSSPAAPRRANFSCLWTYLEDVRNDLTVMLVRSVIYAGEKPVEVLAPKQTVVVPVIVDRRDV